MLNRRAHSSMLSTKVDVNTGMVAAGRLQSLIDSRDYSHDLLMMRVQMDQICDAVKSTVPQEMWGEIIEKLEELEQHSEALDVDTDSFDDADDDPFDPTEFIDDDEFDLRSARRHRGRWGPLPVWPQLFGGLGGEGGDGLAHCQQVVSRCSLPSASRTPARSPSMRSRGCCAWHLVSTTFTGRRPWR